jgi:hypothetical protein
MSYALHFKLTHARDDLIAEAVDELRQFVATRRGMKPRPGSRLERQIDTARRVVAAYDREKRALAAAASQR